MPGPLRCVEGEEAECEAMEGLRCYRRGWTRSSRSAVGTAMAGMEWVADMDSANLALAPGVETGSLLDQFR